MRWEGGVVLFAMFLFLSSCVQPELPPSLPSTELPTAKATPSETTEKLEDKVTISIVYDNNSYDQCLKTSWGFSCLIRGLEKNVLFDTGGNSALLLHNMKELKIDSQEIEVVVLSHIHGDHVGGLSGFLKENPHVIVYVPQSFLQSFKESAESFGAKVNEVSGVKELLARAYSTGELGTVIKEQSLVITTSKGLVIVTGCAHPGVVTIIRKAKEIFPDRQVYLVMGGFHLAGESTARIQSIIEQFQQLAVQKVAPCHCSGDETRSLFRQAYSEGYIESGAGRIITVP
jgi:7,8-dihydropterin-6-yl-methyl-4-(beta-D-ribofuranosyl)aminobenzene 5'-phosphate synthase